MTKTPQKHTQIQMMVKHIKGLISKKSLVQECADDDLRPRGCTRVGTFALDMNEAFNKVNLGPDVTLTIQNKIDQNG